MAYNVEEYIDKFGKQRLIDLIFTEGLTQVQIHKVLKISTSSKRLSSSIYKRIYKYLGIENIPYPEDRQDIRKLKLEFDRVKGNYWESDYISEYLLYKLQSPSINYSEGIKRLVISFPKHPKSNKNSNQIKAHIVLWELIHEQYIDEDCWVVPVDGNYTNLDINNWILVNINLYKHERFSGVNNPSYKHGLSLRPKQGGWDTISKNYLKANNKCKLCNSSNDLVTHHIINYHLFKDYNLANIKYNLLALCRSCHTSIHLNNTNIKALIEATQYSKLLELLETLKSQVPDTLIEIYRDVEKQLGLTDNQQPST